MRFRSNGTGSCPCLPTLRSFGIFDDRVQVRIGSFLHDYGLGYGMLTCQSHDLNKPPSCYDETCKSNGNIGLPSWCVREWCYVNGSECGISSTPSTYNLVGLEDPMQDLHYSYDACGACDTFTNSTWALSNFTDDRAAEGGDAPLLSTELQVAIVLVCVLLVLLFCIQRRHRRILTRKLQLLMAARLRDTIDNTLAEPKPLRA